MNDPYLTISELAAHWRVSRQWVSQRMNVIPHRKIGNKKIIKLSEAEKYMEARRGGSPLALL